MTLSDSDSRAKIISLLDARDSTTLQHGENNKYFEWDYNEITSAYTIITALDKLWNIARFVLSIKLIIHRDNFKRNCLFFLSFTMHARNHRILAIYSNLEVIARSKLSWRVPLPSTRRSLRKTVTDVVWRVMVSWRSLRRVLLAGWIIDELAMGSWDLAAAIRVSSFARYSRAFFLALDRPSVTLRETYVVVPLIVYAKHDVLRSITVAVYRYPPLCVYIMHTKTPRNHPLQNPHPQGYLSYVSYMSVMCTVFDPRKALRCLFQQINFRIFFSHVINYLFRNFSNFIVPLLCV